MEETLFAKGLFLQRAMQQLDLQKLKTMAF